MLVDDGVIGLVGAKRSQGNDVYLSAAKAWIDGLFHRISFQTLIYDIPRRMRPVC